MRRALVGLPVAWILLLSLLAPAVAAEVAPESGQRETASEPARPSQRSITGRVTETMSAEHYTYLEVATDSGKLWAVGPRTRVAVGETVSLSGGFRMADFHSQYLDRSFDEIYMVTSIEVAGGGNPGAGEGAHPRSRARAEEAFPAGAVAVDGAGIKPVEGGHTIAEIFDGRRLLAGEQVTVRGRVVKVSSGILGRNWLRLEDATTGPQSVPNLVVTTSDPAAVGETVLARGTVVVDRDLGSGYAYEVLLEEARIVIEARP